MLPLVGHEPLRKRFAQAIDTDALPASILLHGTPGSGKERLALWIAQRLLCARPVPGGEPCGACQQCSYALKGAHPDILWVFPRPKGKNSDPDADEVLEDLAEGIEDRLKAKSAWDAPDPTDSIYVATIRAVVQRAALTPALAKRKAIVMGDAHRMISQEGSDQAANAFLKLLEEPLASTTIILTSSMPSALLPTIRSRVAAVRVRPLSPKARDELAAHGVASDEKDTARKSAESLLEAATQGAEARYRIALRQGGSGARGGFTASLDALTALLHERSHASASAGRDDAAAGFARAIAFVEDAKAVARQNANPQLLTAVLLEDIAGVLAS